MRKQFIVLGVVGLTGCRAFDPALLTPLSAPLPVRLPRLTAQVLPLHFCAHFDSQAVTRYVDTLFAREVRQVLADSTGPVLGTAVLTTHCVHYGQGGGYSYLAGITAGASTLLGLPWIRHQCTVDLQVDVRNRRRELVGTYYAQGKAVLRGGLYSRPNYRERDYARIVYLQSVRQGLQQIAAQIQGEVPTLQQELQP